MTYLKGEKEARQEIYEANGIIVFFIHGKTVVLYSKSLRSTM